MDKKKVRVQNDVMGQSKFFIDENKKTIHKEQKKLQLELTTSEDGAGEQELRALPPLNLLIFYTFWFLLVFSPGCSVVFFLLSLTFYFCSNVVDNIKVQMFFLQLGTCFFDSADLSAANTWTQQFSATC